MKKAYVKPEIIVVELRSEERIGNGLLISNSDKNCHVNPAGNWTNAS